MTRTEKLLDNIDRRFQQAMAAMPIVSEREEAAGSISLARHKEILENRCQLSFANGAFHMLAAQAMDQSNARIKANKK